MQRDNDTLRSQQSEMQLQRDTAVSKFEKLLSDKKKLEIELYSKVSV